MEKVHVLDIKERSTDRNRGVDCFAGSVYSKETDTHINVRLQGMMELEKSHEKEGVNLC